MLNVELLKEDAKAPEKRVEDAGYDIYPAFEEDNMVIAPQETKLVPTGFATAFSRGLVALVRERGSSGCLNLSVRAGVIDSGYRGEWFIAINNTGDKFIIISKSCEEVEERAKSIHYPYEKAIAQFILTDAYHEDTMLVSDIKEFESERGEGMLGSTD
ncbi:MAG: dUTP diphosphatase [Clostridia bacterium]